MAISVSVVIPTYKRDELLYRCLNSLFMQEFDPLAYEIIVADDASNQSTKQLIERESSKRYFPVLRYIPVTRLHGPAAARNCGWRAAAGNIIAFTDDDCIPTPNWLEAGVAAFTDEVVGVSGKITVPIPLFPTDYQYNTSKLQDSKFVTANCFYLRETLYAVGGFDEKFTAAWREDADLYFTMLKNNKKMICIPDAVVIHPVRQASWGVGLKEHKKIMFNALLYKKHPLLYRKIVQRWPPLDYYGIVCAFFLLPASILYGSWYSTFSLISFWAFLTGRFFLKRIKSTSRSLSHITEMAATSVAIPFVAIYWRIYGAIKFRVFFM